jgi:RNA polymerase sigma factor (sigma-70 family)
MSNDLNGGGTEKGFDGNIDQRVEYLFERVLEEKGPELDRIARRAEPTMDRDDCRQQALFRLLRGFPALRERIVSGASEEETSNILFWALVKTMKRLILDEKRRISRQKTDSLETGGPDGAGSAKTEGSAFIRRAKEVFRDVLWREAEEETRREQERRLREAMDALQQKNPVRHRIVSQRLEEVSDEEIARSVGLSEEDVKKEWSLAVKQLRYYLKTYPPGVRP